MCSLLGYYWKVFLRRPGTLRCYGVASLQGVGGTASTATHCPPSFAISPFASSQHLILPFSMAFFSPGSTTSQTATQGT